ncbi:MAG: LCP family protein [Fimbriimonadaceae bacterium]
MAEPRKTSKGTKTTSKKAFFGGLFYTFFLGFCLVIGAFAGWLGQSKFISSGGLGNPLMPPPPPTKVFGEDNLTVLILGCDKELYYKGAQVLKQYARSDMMMVVRFDFDRKMVGAVSIPRDTLCSLPGYRTEKINAFHKIGGPDLAKAAVEEILPQVHIDRVMVLNFDAFMEIIDMVGGVDVYVPRDMKYDDDAAKLHIDLKKGKQHLDGYEAMGFVRWRKNNNGRGGDSDFERQKRQKDLMLSLKQRLFANWTKAPAILDKSIEISGKTFSNQEILTLALFMKNLGADEKIRMGQIPVNDIEGTYDLSVDRSKLMDVLQQYQIVPTETLAKKDSQ